MSKVEAVREKAERREGYCAYVHNDRYIVGTFSVTEARAKELARERMSDHLHAKGYTVVPVVLTVTPAEQDSPQED